MVTRLALLDDRRGDWTLNEGVRDAALGGDSVQPPAEADQRPGSAVQIPNPVEPAPPAAQRPGIGQMPDRLLHQRAQPGPAAVVGSLPVGEPVLGGPVPDRGMPVLAALGHAPKPPIQQARHAAGVQRLVEPRQRDELVLVAAARPAAVTPQRSPWTVDTAKPWAVCAWRLVSYQTFWLAHPQGRCTQVASPSTKTASPVRAISPRRSRRSAMVVMNVPSGWQYPSAASPASNRSMLSPTSVLEIPTIRPARRL